MQTAICRYIQTIMIIWCLVQPGCMVQNTTPLLKDNLQFQGRVDTTNRNVFKLYWPGSSIKTRFIGSSLKATLEDENGRNRYAVIIDDKRNYTLRLRASKKQYTLVDGLARGEHTVTLYRLTDWFDGSTRFYGFQYDDNATVQSLPEKQRSIEFYGNSITVGAGMLERDKSSPRGNSTDNYLSYAALVSRHFEANYSCIAVTGIGMMVSWGSEIMPEMYNRLNPADSGSVWDFSQNIPGLVVVNLLQNDCTLFSMPSHEQFKRRFGTTLPGEESIIENYRGFITKIRNHYPNAYIICALGSMDAVQTGSPWPGYVRKAVSMMNDEKIFTLFFNFINGPGHPNASEHRQMARVLIEFIEKNIHW